MVIHITKSDITNYVHPRNKKERNIWKSHPLLQSYQKKRKNIVPLFAGWKRAGIFQLKDAKNASASMPGKFDWI